MQGFTSFAPDDPSRETLEQNFCELNQVQPDYLADEGSTVVSIWTDT